ncbi:5'-methylthioadenosine/adenosylhomocysteine nucleosidase [Alkalihalobacillus sp. LMS39]|uniref:5'-methylthioadenosine/adenosylhomocysteine nucleosidase n=1 Tax=Alkalihalobacillus sp. LMS39 TaxID=2924032 RepID=UPI001FB35315|nr:5'-methylthioadenosine/adenosylhomocysteine nucleosidase [Alkalihalobacillus sp. LMS39]UOE93469.1 5'-methylthioadenosine/adenosylhomocysteine nucleosidase [Alkalihalobacillus sp. LMS39]
MTIGIIGAMDEEIALLKEEMTIEKEEVFALITFYEGRLLGKRVVVCKSGVGKVNASITTQLLIDKFSVQEILFTGVAGALDPSLQIGDIVISTSAIQHDIDASPLGFKKGEVPMFHRSSDFEAASHLIGLASEASKNMNRKVVQGRIASGDQFIADERKVKEIYQQFNAVCVEMEGAAVAHVATVNDVPFIIIRSISDKANGEAQMSFEEFTILASEQSYNMIKHILLSKKAE